jgi:hypothetical protein
MQPQNIRAPRPSACRPLLTALALACIASHALADDPNPYYVGVSTGISHDSNIFGLPTGAQGDTYYSLGLLAGIDQPFGRQHFTASGNVKYNKFSHLTDLDNTSFGLNTRLDWEALDRLSGTVSLGLNQNLANYTTTTSQLLTVKNVETDGQFLARAQYGLVSLLSLDGQYTHQQVRYSATAYDIYETTQDSIRAGLLYRPSGLLTLGGYVQTSHGYYPGVHDAQGNEETYDRNDFVLTGNWIATGQSSFDGRVSVGRQSYDHTSENDFSGVTGQLTWNYRPTGKLGLATTVSRDTGFNSGFLSAPTGSGAATNDISRLTTSIAVAATYAATGKIAFNGGARYAHRSLNNSINVTNGSPVALAQGTDTIQSEYLGVTYTPLRSLQFACNVGHTSRSVSQGLPTYLSYPYSDNTVGCSAQFTVQ